MNVLGIIPARYGSSRLPGKPLANINGKPMIQHVYERASQALEQIVVATDDQRIMDAVKGFGGEAILTSQAHETGTNRCLEAYEIWSARGQKAEVIINIQGDEPLLESLVLSDLAACFGDSDVQMATLGVQLVDADELHNENRVFLIKNAQEDAIYFSRSPLPHVRGVERDSWTNHHPYYKHLGIYAYTPSALSLFASMPSSALERAESLEQNRWIEAGHKIRVHITNHDSIAVDTAEDLESVRKLMQS